MTPRQAIAAHREGEISGTALARLLAQFNAWKVPASLAEGKARLAFTTSDEGTWMHVCSDDASYAQFCEKTAWEGSYLDLPGTSVFAAIPPDCAGLNVDPHGDHAIHYQGEQLQTLRDLAAAIEVERILYGVDVPDPFRRLLAYPNYRVVLRATDEGKTQLLLAPDGRQRLLAPVFTAQDTLDTFLTRSVDGTGIIPIVSTLDGRSLFTMLSKMRLHGIVFNCNGPTPPKALSAQFAQEVLERA
jgi:hypothetical protein